jgi:hypothetical protein
VGGWYLASVTQQPSQVSRRPTGRWDLVGAETAGDEDFATSIFSDADGGLADDAPAEDD